MQNPDSLHTYIKHLHIDKKKSTQEQKEHSHWKFYKKENVKTLNNSTWRKQFIWVCPPQSQIFGF